ncbi:MAG TPA: class II fumarate hydratase [Woeseiaceae bacterium]|nr:class II fumarate hydratase [Woeseiaceae bacterium]
MSNKDYRKELDSMGELLVPKNALWGAQTQRAIENFPISGIKMPRQFISALGLVKWAAASANENLGLLENDVAKAIQDASQEVIEGKHDEQFPVDVFQTGSGTSSNMNANEVIGNLAAKILGKKVHPNDDVNMGQSSNDVIPTCIHIAAMIGLQDNLLPALTKLIEELQIKANALEGIVKTGRTHLMDAMPITMAQEIGGWKSQISHASDRITDSMSRLSDLAQGGTAVGTGINTHKDFGKMFVNIISKKTKINFQVPSSYFESLASQDAAVEISGQLKVLAISLIKISNDLRWMNSGPLAGIGEIKLPELQPGSSIMPGKVNPVIPEAVAMVCAQVIGNDAAIAIAGQSGNFQLNVMLPVVAYNLLQSIEILTNASDVLKEKAIKDFTVDESNIKKTLNQNPILVTALNSVIGYELGAKIVKTAYQNDRSIKEVAMEMTDLDESELDHLLNPETLTNAD